MIFDHRASGATAGDTSGVFSAQDFQSAMMGQSSMTPSSSTSGGQAAGAQQQQQQPLDLQDVLRADQVIASGVLGDQSGMYVEIRIVLNPHA